MPSEPNRPVTRPHIDCKDHRFFGGNMHAAAYCQIMQDTHNKAVETLYLNVKGD